MTMSKLVVDMLIIVKGCAVIVICYWRTMYMSGDQLSTRRAAAGFLRLSLVLAG